jgi:hypothetical protein
MLSRFDMLLGWVTEHDPFSFCFYMGNLERDRSMNNLCLPFLLVSCNPFFKLTM